MSDFDDYQGEMGMKDMTDREIESLFDGSIDPSDDLAPLIDVIGKLRAEAGVPLSEETHGGLVAAAVTAAATARQVAEVRGSRRPVSVLVSLRRRVAAMAAAAALFVGGMTGMAVAADNAKPGDALYGLDRALESVGIGNGQATERLEEVQALFEAGEVPRGLQHAADAVEKQSPDDPSASVALLEAADRVLSNGSEQSAATRDMVAGLLTYLAENANDIDGRQVAEIAREIGRSDKTPGPPSEVSTPNNPGPPEQKPVDPPRRPDSPPGQDKSSKNKP